MGKTRNSGLAHGTLGSPQTSLTQENATNKANELASKAHKKTNKRNTSKTIAYNLANSFSVKSVNFIKIIQKGNKIKVSLKSIPNSVTIVKYKNRVIYERYYNENGDVYLDIDYTDHGNKKTHPIIPHEHIWTKEGNSYNRSKWRKIIK